MKMQMNNLPLNKSNRTQFYQLKGKIIKKFNLLSLTGFALKFIKVC